MLYSIANLLVAGVADKRGALSCVFLDEDGSTFATDRMCLVVVEPCKTKDEDFRVADVEPVEVREGGVAIQTELAKEVLKAIPKQPMRQAHKHAALTRCDARVQFATTKDGVAAGRSSDNRVRTALPDVKTFLQSGSETQASVCISLKRLKKIVDVMDKMCGGDEAQPVFIELGDRGEPMRLRTQSYMTGQRVLGVVTALQADEWLKLNKWERGLLDRGVKPKKVAKRKGKKQVAKRRHR